QFAGALACATPDLTGYGYEFESANFCAPAADHAGPAAHVMYVNPVYGTRLSLFTVPHWGMSDVPDREPPDRHHPFVHSLADCDTNALLAWHEGSMTYILTGPVDAEAMAEMIGDLELVSSNGR